MAWLYLENNSPQEAPHNCNCVCVKLGLKAQLLLVMFWGKFFYCFKSLLQVFIPNVAMGDYPFPGALSWRGALIRVKNKFQGQGCVGGYVSRGELLGGGGKREEIYMK